MRKLLIAHPRLSDAATLTASSEAPSTPVTFLQSMSPRDLWRANDLVDLQVDVHHDEDLLSLVGGWSFVALPFSNFGDGDTYEILSATTQAGLDVDPWSSGVLPGWPIAGLEDFPHVPAFHYLGDAEANTDPWMRIRFTVANPKLPKGYAGAPYFQAGRLYVSLPWRPPYHMKRGYQIAGGERGGARVETQGGGYRTREGVEKRTARFTVHFGGLDEMMEQAGEIDRLRGETRDVVAIYDPEHATQVHRLFFYGLMRVHELNHEDADVHEKRYEIQEL